MSNLSLFLKKNKKVKENVKFPATKSLCDEKGNPLEWEIKPLTTRESDDIREACTIEIPVKGKPNMFRQKVNSSKFGAKMLASSIVFPDLYNGRCKHLPLYFLTFTMQNFKILMVFPHLKTWFVK